MSNKILTALALALLLAPAAVLAAESYSIDEDHSHIGFTARHFGISKVRGEFEQFEAALAVDEENLAASSIELTIQAGSIDTGNERRDGHLKSDDFLGVEQYPTIVFRSRSITAAGGGEYEVAGDLTIRETTRAITFPVKVSGPLEDPWGNIRLGIEGDLKIDRQDYGVKWDNTLPGGELVVSDEVAITFSLETMRPVKKAQG